MKEIADIITAYRDAAIEGKKTALATVVMVEGSAYRKAGARMLITEDGQLTGAISGGCLEGDALRKARMVILQQQPLLVTYDTTDEDDAKLGVGLGCNGIIHILIEPITDHAHNPIALLKTIVSDRRPAVLVTLFCIEDKKAPQPGTCLCLTTEDTIISASPDLFNSATLINHAKKVLGNHRSEIINYPASVNYTAFVEFVKPAISLVIAGAGNDAMPLIKIAAVLGWDITVIDGRPAYATTARFPFATRVIVSVPEKVLSCLSPDDRTAFVLMTHNYNYELALLKELLSVRLPYIGILGPRKKLDRMLAELQDNGMTISEEHLEHIYGPVGLDIGSENAEEIALSIVSEINAVLSSRKGDFLKNKPVPVDSDRLNLS